MNAKPIGVFDSGLGGLTVVRAIRRDLPEEAVVYFGDLAHLPYGTKSKTQIQRFSLENTEFLMEKGIKALVIACNSSSSAAFQVLRRRFAIPMVSVVEPAVEESLEVTRSGRIGIIGTPATIESRVYEAALRRRRPTVRAFSQSCPLFVPLVEEGWLNGGVAERVVEKYLGPLVRNRIDTLILGCTHYPILKEAIQSFVGPEVRLVDSAQPTVKRLQSILKKEDLLSKRKQPGKFEIYVSDLPRTFRSVGERFLGERLPSIQVIR